VVPERGRGASLLELVGIGIGIVLTGRSALLGKGVESSKKGVVVAAAAPALCFDDLDSVADLVD
jgi:hypothetical protein